VHIKGSTDTDQGIRRQRSDMCGHPMLLLGRTQADPHDLRCGSINQIYDLLVLVGGQGTERWRVRTGQPETWEAHHEVLGEPVGDSRRTTVKEDGPVLSIREIE